MKIKRILLSVLVIGSLAGCASSGSDKNAEAKKDDTTKASEEIRTNMSFLNDMNAMEAVFGNENWMLIDKKDTSYLYFSRLGDFQFNTYAYKLVKGDSAKVDHDKITPDKNNLSWHFDGKKLLITSATTARIVGSAAGADSANYEFVRLDANKIGITYPDKKKTVLQKTLPFSLFLIRSRYDYANGTKLAFDSSRFNKKK